MAMSKGERDKLVTLMTSTENSGHLADDVEIAGGYNYESAMLEVAESEPTRSIIRAVFCSLHGGNWVYDRAISAIKKYMHRDSTWNAALVKDGTTISKTDTYDQVGVQPLEVNDGKFVFTQVCDSVHGGNMVVSGESGGASGISWVTDSDGYMHFSGTRIPTTDWVCVLTGPTESTYYTLKAGKTYYFSSCEENDLCVVPSEQFHGRLYDNNGTVLAKEYLTHYYTPTVDTQVLIKFFFPGQFTCYSGLTMKPCLAEVETADFNAPSYTLSTLSIPSPGHIKVGNRTNVNRGTDWGTVEQWTPTISNKALTNVAPVVSSFASGALALSAGSAQYATRIVQSKNHPNAMFMSGQFHVSCPVLASYSDTCIDFYVVTCQDPTGEYEVNTVPGSKGSLTVVSTKFVGSTLISTNNEWGNVSFVIPQLPTRNGCSFLIAQLRSPTHNLNSTNFSDISYANKVYARANVNAEMFGEFELNRSVLNGTDELV